MNSKLIVVGLFAPWLVLSAFAEDCTDGRFKGPTAKLLQSAYRDALDGTPDMAETRGKLAAFRQTERTCIGQNTLDYVVALIDVNEAPLQQAVDALPTIVRSSAPDHEKARMVRRVIHRLYQEKQYTAALAFARQAHELYPDRTSFDRETALLLAFTGAFDEARAIADAQFDASLKTTPKDIVPYAAWVWLAIEELSGDADARDAVLAKLSAHLGKDAAPVIAEDMPGPVLAIVMAREFGGDGVSQPSVPPLPSYPTRMAALGIEGSCETYFDVNAEGIPEKVTAVCTDEGFRKEAERSVAEVKFRPFLIDGVPQRRVSMTYPLEFRLEY